jgi:hypothetical protein
MTKWLEFEREASHFVMQGGSSAIAAGEKGVMVRQMSGSACR